MKVMFWIERLQQNVGFHANTPHWNRTIGHAAEPTVVEDLARMRSESPEDSYRVVKVTEEVLEL